LYVCFKNEMHEGRGMKRRGTRREFEWDQTNPGKGLVASGFEPKGTSWN
jgi:hypothetical protein